MRAESRGAACAAQINTNMLDSSLVYGQGKTRPHPRLAPTLVQRVHRRQVGAWGGQRWKVRRPSAPRATHHRLEAHANSSTRRLACASWLRCQIPRQSACQTVPERYNGIRACCYPKEPQIPYDVYVRKSWRTARSWCDALYPFLGAWISRGSSPIYAMPWLSPQKKCWPPLGGGGGVYPGSWWTMRQGQCFYTRFDSMLASL